MFEDIKRDIEANIRGIRLWTENIYKGQEEDSRGPDPFGFRETSAGLFFVYIYGVYEEIVRRIITDTIRALNSSGIHIEQCSYGLYPLAFSAEFDSLCGAGSQTKWQNRWKISQKIQDNPEINIPLELFPTDGKNLKHRQLSSLFCSFGLECDPLPRAEIGGYITEIVNNRNYIAHGDDLPKNIGRRYTKEDLLKRCDIVSEVCNYIAESFEKYIQENKFTKTPST